jgi:hypothetical protein
MVSDRHGHRAAVSASRLKVSSNLRRVLTEVFLTGLIIYVLPNSLSSIRSSPTAHLN